ncbi:MAG: DNA primase [Flavobacteriales bacterium]|jgi:DNA primase|nr:DNA primase [Flavobacteriales bacterium]
MIPKETIDHIFETARVEEVVGDFVQLKKKGTNLWGNCPFHNEKTPSFSVSPAKGIYKCFGCGKGGNSVNFIMDHEQQTYPEALRYLAKKYNIEIEEEQQTPEQMAEQTERESLYLVLAFAQRTFASNLLKTDEGQSIGLSYFKERGFSMETIEKFGLGYCFDRYDSFGNKALEEQYNRKFLEDSGLCLDREGKLIDRFKGRVMFPIHNLSGRVIAFGGRTLRSDKKVAKYINSPETDVYHKSNIVYGIYQAKSEIIKKDNCFVVEGYTDVISLHQAGIHNVVASSGTSLTVEQIRLVKRYTNNLTIMYDGDDAGIKASFRGIDLVLEEGMNVRTVLFPDGEDPDSFSKKMDEEELTAFIDTNSKDFIQFKAQLLSEEAKGDPIKMAGLIKDIISSIALIPDPIIRNLYVRQCSSIMSMDEEVLMMELNRNRRKNFSDKQRSGNSNFTEAPVQEEQPIVRKTNQELKKRDSEFQEQDIIRILILYSEKEIEFDIWDEAEEKVVDQEKVNVVDFIVTELLEDEIKFENELFKVVFAEFAQMFEEKKIPTEQHFINHQNPEISSLAVNFFAQPYIVSERWKEHNVVTLMEEDKLKQSILSSLNVLKLRKLETMITETRDLLKVAEEEQLMELMEKLNRQLGVRKVLAKEIGSTILK